MNQFTASLWGDEGFSAILSMRPPWEIIQIIIKDTSPPLWNLWEWLIFNTLGTDEIYIRFLAFSFFLGTVFFTFKIASHFFSKTTAFLAAILIFLNPFFFTYAFEGRMYSIMALGVTASMYFFIKRNWGWYIFWTLWALYSHHFAIFSVFTQGIWFLYEFLIGNRKVAKQMFKTFVIVAIGYLPWIYPLYLQTTKVGGGFWLGKPDLNDLAKLIGDYLAEGIKLQSLKIFGYQIYKIALWLSLTALILRKWVKDIKKTVFLLMWFLTPILATWLISQKFTSIFFNRYLLYSIPAAMIILASQRRKLSTILIAFLVVLFAVIDFNYFTHPTKIPFRDLADYVKSTRKEGDYLINEDAGNHKLWESKYYGIPAPIYNPLDTPLPFFVGTALMEPDDTINEIPTGVKRIGAITYKGSRDLKIKNFVPVEEKSFGNLNFIWLQRDL